MIYPVIAYGDPILKKVAAEIKQEGDIDVKEIAANMFDTMYEASGVGIAGPQVGISKRIFVIDSNLMLDEDSKEEGMKMVFINPEIVEEDGDDWGYEEGCLSIPGIRGEIFRPERITLSWFDENWVKHEKEFDGMTARVIQHEYDHLDGILFTEMLSPLKRRLLKGKLDKITKGQCNYDYKMKFYKK
ncbi:peptide deformylase [Limibacter armeniacum]|uniref:peptide deformylase n=1 Tax=Limibacter armeniacum TaxID=466084 RepID=UPI002FE5CB81